MADAAIGLPRRAKSLEHYDTPRAPGTRRAVRSPIAALSLMRCVSTTLLRARWEGCLHFTALLAALVPPTRECSYWLG